MPTSISENRALAFRQNIRRLLEREWLSQKDAAEQIGVRYKWLRRMCHHGLERIDKRTASDLDKLATWFGLEIAQFWEEEIAERKQPIPGQALVKWTGSKRRQAKEIVGHFPDKISTYYEPFVGGGSVLYQLLESAISVERYRCSDTCQPLIGLWRLVKDVPRQIVESYEEMWGKLKERGAEFYYRVREAFNEANDPCVFFFLLRTCRNGMVRFNKAGHFTTAFHYGRIGMQPEVVKGVIEDWARKLNENDVRFYVRDYRRVQSEVGDLLYLDPPYRANRRQEFYSGTIEYSQFFQWARKQTGSYLISLEGTVGGSDRMREVPQDIYDEHRLINAGHASFPRLNGNGATAVRDSLYIRLR